MRSTVGSVGGKYAEATEEKENQWREDAERVVRLAVTEYSS